MILLPQTREPTWKSGFARSASESAHPRLWKSLLGAWCPGLGPTGITTLHDVSAFKNNGTFNGSMTAADWVISEGRYTLDYDGVDDFVDLGSETMISETAPFTLSLRINPSVTSGFPRVCVFKTDGTDGLVFAIGGTSGSYRGFIWGSDVWSPVGIDVSSAIFTNVWSHVIVTYNGEGVGSGTFPNYTGYINGVSQTTYDVNVFGSNPQNNRIAFGSAGGDYYSGFVDDVLIYDRVLNATEVKKLFTIGRGGIFQRRRRVIVKAPVVAGGISPALLKKPIRRVLRPVF